MRQFSLEEYIRHPDRKVVTRDGRSVRIICTDKKSSGYPIVALLEYSDENTSNKEAVIFYNEKGKINLCNNNVDLFFATENEEKNDTSTTTAKITWGGTSMKPFSLDEYLKNPNRKIITKDGKSVRIICTDRRGLNVKPIAALITMLNGDEVIETYWANGMVTRGCKDNPYDLFFATEKHEGWVNLYVSDKTLLSTDCALYNTKEEAERNKYLYNYKATAKIEWEE